MINLSLLGKMSLRLMFSYSSNLIWHLLLGNPLESLEFFCVFSFHLQPVLKNTADEEISFLIISKGNDHEVEFHVIEIELFQEIEFLIMRSKLCLFMRLNLSNNIDQEFLTSIMRSKFQKALLGILISWSIC